MFRVDLPLDTQVA